MRSERRTAHRTRVYQGANLVFNGRQSVLGCTIRNKSDTGAMVRMSDWMILPSSFELDVHAGGETRRVRECWRRGDDIGLAFLSPDECPVAKPISLDDARAKRSARRG